MDQKQQIAGLVHKIDELRAERAHHWAMVQTSVADERTDDAISLLNAYFSLKVKLERAEADLVGLLQGYFSDK